MVETDRARRLDWWRNSAWWSLAASGATIIGVLMAAAVVDRSEVDWGGSSVAEIKRELDRIDAQQQQIARIREQVIKDLRQNRPPPLLEVLAKRQDAIEARQTRIERALGSDPVKALETPMLRRDIEALRDSNERQIEALGKAIDQVYELSQWLLGALVVGILSLAIGNLVARKEKV